MFYALQKDSTHQVFRFGCDPKWAGSPPAGFSCLELDAKTLPDPETQNDPTGPTGKLLLGFFGIVTTENKLMRRMTNSEIDQYCLAILKKYRCQKINKKTDDLLMDGFEFPPSSGKFFALDTQTQLRAFGSDYVRNWPEYQYPVKWNTKDDTDQIELQNADQVRAFFLVGMATLRSKIDSGTTIKEQIRNAANAADVLAINDPR